MLTDPAVAPPSIRRSIWPWLRLGPAAWCALIASFSVLLLLLASLRQPDQAFKLTSLAAALLTTLAFAREIRLARHRRDLPMIAAAGALAAFEIGVAWVHARHAPWPPPGWITAILVLAGLAWFAANAQHIAVADMPNAIAESLLPASLLAFAAIFTVPDSTFRSLGQDTSVWLMSGSVIALFFGAAALTPYSVPLSCATLGATATTLGMLSGNEAIAALGASGIALAGGLLLAGLPGPREPRPPALMARRIEYVLGPSLVGLAVIALSLYDGANAHHETALRSAAGAAFALLLVRQAMLLWSQRAMYDRAAREMHALAQRASIDELTQLPNRSALLTRLEEELERFRRHRLPVSLIFIDVDHFKSINDRFGHAAGDEVLRAVGATLRGAVRFIDFVGRYGGEEFLVIAPSTAIADAVILAERLRVAVAEMPLPNANDGESRLTISLGIAEHPSSATTPADLIDAADVAMYQSKREGRNRVSIAEPPNG